jgi:hypothetical protein
MQATPRDRPRDAGTTRGIASQTTITLLVIIILMVMGWVLTEEEKPQPQPEPAVEAPAPRPATTRALEAIDAPDIPRRTGEAAQAAALGEESAPTGDIPGDEPVAAAADTDTPASTDVPKDSAPVATAAGVEDAGEAPAPEPPPLTLENSDTAVREAFGQSAKAEGYAAAILDNDNLIQRGVAAIDLLRRGQTPGQLIRLPRLQGEFAVTRTGKDTAVIDPAGYRRYDTPVATLLAVEPAVAASVFHRFRGLMEAAYAELGYPAANLDNALIAALDQVLATPVPDNATALKRHEAVWRYADETLEQRPALQKQLMRTGPDNLRRIKAWASALRERLLLP